MDASIKVENFRSIKNASFIVKPGLNVIVGANGSGKTNVLHALKFLSDVVASGASLAMAKAGGPSRNFRRGESVIKFCVEIPLGTTLYSGKKALYKFHWEISVGSSGGDQFVHVTRESFRIVANTDQGPAQVLSLELVRGARKKPKGTLTIESEEKLTRKLFESSTWSLSSDTKAEIFFKAKAELGNVLTEARKRPQDQSSLDEVSRVHHLVRDLFRELMSLEEFNISPDVARQAVDPMPVPRMGPDGSGLSEVIAALEANQLHRLRGRNPFVFGGPYINTYFYDPLWSSSTKKNPLAEIVENLRSAVSSIDSMETQIDPSTGRRFVTFGSNGSRFRPQEISDGTFKWLCLLVALFVPTARVILMEEPENYMHPWMQQRFIALVRDQAKRGWRSVILSTHSVTVLNALSVDELRVAYQLDGETHVDVVNNRADIEALLASTTFGLGDIWVSGEFGGVTGGN